MILPALTEAIRLGDSRLRHYALAALQGELMWTRDAGRVESTLPSLLITLSDPDAGVRADSAELLWSFGQRAAPAVPELARAVGDPHWYVREVAAHALESIGPLAAEAAPALVAAALRIRSSPVSFVHAEEQLEWFEHALVSVGPACVPALVEAMPAAPPEIRASFARVLARIGPEAASAVPILVEELRGEDGQAKEAAEALGRIGSSEPAVIEALIGALGHRWTGVRVAVARAVGKVGRADAGAARALAAALGDPDVGVRRVALASLGELGPAPPDTLARMLEAVRQQPSAFREQFGVLAAVEPSATQVAPFLAERLSDADRLVRRAAATTLAQMGAGARGVVPALLAALERPAAVDDQGATRIREVDDGVYLEALGRIGGPEVVEAVPAMVRYLRDTATRGSAITALGSLGPDASAAAPALLTLMGDSYAPGLQDTIAQMGPAVIPPLLERLREDPGDICFLSPILERMGPAAAAPVVVEAAGGNYLCEPAVTAMLARLGPDGVAAAIPAISSSDRKTQLAATRAVSLVGPDAKAAIPALIGALHGDDGYVSAAAGKALARIGPDTVPALVRLLADPSVRERAARVLGQLGAASAPAVPHLVALLDDAEATRCAAGALARVGPAAAPAVPALARLTRSADSRTGMAAVNALGSIRTQAAIDALVEVVDSAPGLRGSAASWLGQAGAGRAVPALARLARAADVDDCLDAVDALADIGTTPAEEALVEILQDHQRPPVRVRAIERLGKMKTAGESALGALTRAVRDSDAWVRSSAVEALGNIGGPTARDSLIERLGADPLLSIRVRSVVMLGRLAEDEVAIQALEAALGDRDAKVRKAASGVLASLE